MKVQKISEFQHHLAFNFLDTNFDVFYNRFLESDLGKIYRAIPWDEMIGNIPFCVYFNFLLSKYIIFSTVLTNGNETKA